MEFYIVGLIALIFYAFYQNTSTKKIIDKFKSSENIHLFNLLNQKVLELNSNKLNEDITFVKPTDYFDIPMNSWDFEGFNETIISAHKKCEDLGVIVLS